MTGLLAGAVLVLIAWSLGRDAVATVRDADGGTRLVLAAWRPWMLLAAPALLAAVVVAAVLLLKVPGLSWGWWHALGGVGSLAAGQSSETPPQLAWLGWLVPFLLVVALPRLALAEEDLFRRRAELRGPVATLRSALLFGLTHLIMGIPLAVALALSVAGLGFEAAYRRAFARVGPGPKPGLPPLAELPLAAGWGLPPAAREEWIGRLDRWHDARETARDASVATAAALHMTYNGIIAAGLLVVVLT